MPRRGHLREHRNDHQVSTAKHFIGHDRVVVVFNEQELLKELDQVETFHETKRLNAQASPDLIATIRTFIATGRTRFGDCNGLSEGITGGSIKP